MRQVTIYAKSKLMERAMTVREEQAEHELQLIKSAHIIQVEHLGRDKVGKLRVKIEAHGDYPAAPISG